MSKELLIEKPEMAWYNYRTQQYEYVSPQSYEDYIPQDPSALGLYRCCIQMGRQPIEAAIEVLKACVGEK